MLTAQAQALPGFAGQPPPGSSLRRASCRAAVRVRPSDRVRTRWRMRPSSSAAAAQSATGAAKACEMATSDTRWLWGRCGARQAQVGRRGDQSNERLATSRGRRGGQSKREREPRAPAGPVSRQLDRHRRGAERRVDLQSRELATHLVGACKRKSQSTRARSGAASRLAKSRACDPPSKQWANVENRVDFLRALSNGPT